MEDLLQSRNCTICIFLSVASIVDVLFVELHDAVVTLKTTISIQIIVHRIILCS